MIMLIKIPCILNYFKAESLYNIRNNPRIISTTGKKVDDGYKKQINYYFSGIQRVGCRKMQKVICNLINFDY